MKGLLVAFASTALSLVAPGMAAARSCTVPDGAQVLARHGTTVVWSTQDGLGQRAVACVGRRTVELEVGDGLDTGFVLSRLRFSGRWLAYVDSYTISHNGDGGVRISLVDLRGRLSKASVTLGTWGFSDGRARIVVSGLGVTRDGGLAWRHSANVDPDGAHVADFDAVSVVDRAGGRFVARATPGAITGFRLHGTHVSWVASGVAASANLRGRARCPKDQTACLHP